jgi:hypothetical protein
LDDAARNRDFEAVGGIDADVNSVTRKVLRHKITSGLFAQVAGSALAIRGYFAFSGGGEWLCDACAVVAPRGSDCSTRKE